MVYKIGFIALIDVESEFVTGFYHNGQNLAAPQKQSTKSLKKCGAL